MKPKEFDQLVRQKFDQNEFEYNPRNWDKLAEQMDGRAKKRSVLMWWLMPVAGVAASVALAMGVAPVMQQRTSNAGNEVARVQQHQPVSRSHKAAPAAQQAVAYTDAQPTAVASSHRHTKKETKTTANEEFRISYNNAIGNVSKNNNKATVQAKKEEVAKTDKKKNIDLAANEEVINTFTPANAPRVPRTSIILLGGVNSGSQGKGYSAGASIRRMVSDKVYIEGDIAFVNSTNVQAIGHVDNYSIAIGGGNPSTNNAAKTTDGPETPVVKDYFTPRQVTNISYSQNYAQVTPCIGYKITKRASIGAGPDFQQALADNRPALDPTDPVAQKQAPLFDLGLVGKTEYAITKNLKAAVYYRKSINNVLSPGTDKYIDRNYLQFQVKCAIFNK